MDIIPILDLLDNVSRILEKGSTFRFLILRMQKDLSDELQSAYSVWLCGLKSVLKSVLKSIRLPSSSLYLLQRAWSSILCHKLLCLRRTLLEFLHALAVTICLLALSSEFPNNFRHTCTTMPWTIWPALVVLWGVCWMFYPGQAISAGHDWPHEVSFGRGKYTQSRVRSNVRGLTLS